MKKVLFISVALIVALGALGVGYAKWQDDITITGSVNTGTLVIGIRDITTSDMQNPADWVVPPCDPWEGDCVPCISCSGQWCGPGRVGALNKELKDVADSVSQNGEEVICECSFPVYESITETITNAYPFYAPYTVMDLVSCGSIPAVIESIDITVLDDPGLIMENVVWYWRIQGTHNGGQQIGCGHCGTGLDALVAEVKGKQLHQCDYLNVLLQMVFLETTPQDKDCSFTITVTGVQYNEANLD